MNLWKVLGIVSMCSTLHKIPDIHFPRPEIVFSPEVDGVTGLWRVGPRTLIRKIGRCSLANRTVKGSEQNRTESNSGR